MTVRDLHRALTAGGWSLVRAKRHQIYRCACGQHTVTLAATPSDPRAMRNAMAEVRHCKGATA